MEVRVEQRIVVVTGGGSGIGHACAMRFARAGDAVVIADVSRENAAAVVADIEAHGGTAETLELDVADDASVSAAAEAVEASLGNTAHVLVNSAGILQMPVPLADYGIEDHDRLWRVNYRGTYLCCQAFGVRMAAAGRGAIVNISSVIGPYRAAPLLAYTPAKAAITSLTQTLAGELGPSNVRVNAVAPGTTLTPPNRHRFETGLRDPAVWTETACLRRLVMPEEIAEGVFFLCSSAASAITGITLPIDCGWLAGESWTAYGGLRHQAVPD